MLRRSGPHPQPLSPGRGELEELGGVEELGELEELGEFEELELCSPSPNIDTAGKIHIRQHWPFGKCQWLAFPPTLGTRESTPIKTLVAVSPLSPGRGAGGECNAEPHNSGYSRARMSCFPVTFGCGGIVK